MFIHIDLRRTTHLPADLHLSVSPTNLMIISLNYTVRADMQLPLICDAWSMAEMTHVQVVTADKLWTINILLRNNGKQTLYTKLHKRDTATVGIFTFISALT